MVEKEEQASIGGVELKHDVIFQGGLASPDKNGVSSTEQN